jgi:hypothetical protein
MRKLEAKATRLRGYNQGRRKDSKIQRTKTKVRYMKAETRRAHDAAWRQAVEEWLRDGQSSAVVQPRPALPH